MPRGVLKYILFIGAVTFYIFGCAHKANSHKKIISSIPFDLREIEPGEFVPYVHAQMDGHNIAMILDSGAHDTSIATHHWTKSYKTVKTGYATGVSGKKTPYDVIHIENISFGNQTRNTFPVERRRSDIFGLDLIKGFPFELNFEKRRLNLLDPKKKHELPLSMQILSSGHMYIPLKVMNIKINAIFDTGSTATIVDAKFIREHPEAFSLIGDDSGTDGHSHTKVSSQAYSSQPMTIGKYRFSDLRVVAFEFPPHLRKAMQGSPMILGTNVMRKGNWTFNFKHLSWEVKKIGH